MPNDHARHSAESNRIRKLEAMALQWERCASNAPEVTHRVSDNADRYHAYAQACRDKAAELRETI